MNENDLQATFAQLRGEHAPPLRMTPEAVLATGQRVRRRRRAVMAGIVLATMVAAAVPVLLVLTVYAGDRSTPVSPGAPPSVGSTQTSVPTEMPTHTQAPPKPPGARE